MPELPDPLNHANPLPAGWRWHTGGIGNRLWLRGALIGYVIVLVLVVIGGTSGHSGIATVGDWVDTLTFGALVLGGVPGAMTGQLVTVLRRRAARSPAPRIAAPERPDDLWERLYAECAASVRRTGEAVALAPPSAATDWLVGLHDRMRRELAQAATLAALGRVTFPDVRRMPTEDVLNHSAYRQLTAAVADFTAASTRIADIVAKLVQRPHLDQVEEDLRMLETELPSLAPPDPD